MNLKQKTAEESVKHCYSTWSTSYYEDYYGEKAAYPPIHSKLLQKLLEESGAQNVLDAGCGPASFLRDITQSGMELFGFDLTPEMVTEARSVLGENGVPSDHIWEGNVTDPEAFRAPGPDVPVQFDAAVCVGVLPHIPAVADEQVIANLHAAVRPGGLVIVEARNQFFSLFTLNRYSYDFMKNELIRPDEGMTDDASRDSVIDDVLTRMQNQFRMDLPPVRKGKEDEPGYDEVLSRTHNPLVLKDQVAGAGFKDVRLLFYHYHCLPPMFERDAPEWFREKSLAIEDPEDWRGHFMASAFMVAGRRA